MPPVRNTHYINADDHTKNGLQIGSNQVNDSKMSMHLNQQHSPNSPISLSMSAAKQCQQYGSPSVQHPSGSQQPIQQTPLTKAELRKVNHSIQQLSN